MSNPQIIWSDWHCSWQFCWRINQKSRTYIFNNSVDLVRNTQTILKQLQEEAKLTTDDEEKINLLTIAELIIDMVLLNEKQAKTGCAEIDNFLLDRGMRPLDKRVSAKISSLKEVRKTEFFWYQYDKRVMNKINSINWKTRSFELIYYLNFLFYCIYILILSLSFCVVVLSFVVSDPGFLSLQSLVYHLSLHLYCPNLFISFDLVLSDVCWLHFLDKDSIFLFVLFLLSLHLKETFWFDNLSLFN